MKEITLRADCANCAALCCLALAFDRSALFAIDKAAGEACPHLDVDGACAIHRERSQRGFAGCVSYDCLGAGQRATQLVPGAKDWRSDRAIVKPLSQAFGDLLRAHESLHLLDLAAMLDISSAEHGALAALRVTLVEAGIDGQKIAAARSRIDMFLSGLKAAVGKEGVSSCLPAGKHRLLKRKFAQSPDALS